MSAPYRVPRLAVSDDDDARLAHDDLPRLDADDLAHEYAAALVALASVGRTDPDRAWLVDRVRAVGRALRGRAPHGAPRCR